MYKLINMQVGDTFPISIGQGVEVQIDTEDAFIGDLGDVGGNAADQSKVAPEIVVTIQKGTYHV